MSASAFDLTILIATHNRARVLDDTLKNFTRLDRNGLEVCFVVIDNNSNDDTRQIVERYTNALPLRYLFEPRAGKNFALNKALDEVALGDIVAFTDDDVNPDANWLHAVVEAARHHPEYDLFGGPLRVELPPSAPVWAHDPKVQRFTYALHGLGDKECAYPTERAYPCGANLWMRRSLFDGGRRFDTSIGPRPGRRFMGSETTLLRQLTAEGRGILYVPSAVVGHCIQDDALTVAYVRERARRRGKSAPHATGHFVHNDLHARNRTLWTFVRYVSIMRWCFRLLFAKLSLSPTRRVARSIAPWNGMAADIECLRLAAMTTDEMRADRCAPEIAENPPTGTNRAQ
ncbi:MAG: glycosyltransferase family 2 protein [Phycisphaerales bacterium]|nr:glycosyltransferase family 2 protein [Phycisphaerales bacterium]